MIRIGFLASSKGICVRSREFPEKGSIAHTKSKEKSETGKKYKGKRTVAVVSSKLNSIEAVRDAKFPHHLKVISREWPHNPKKKQ